MNKPTFIYPVHLPAATVTATDTATGYDPANVLEGCEDTAWKPANTTGSKSLIIDLGASMAIGQIAVLGRYLNGVTLEVRGSTDNFVSSDIAISAATVIASKIVNTTWRSFTGGNYRQIKLIFSGLSADFAVQYVACCRAVSLPFLEDGHDPDVYQPTGSQLIGATGTYLGATQQYTLATLSLDFGQITSAQYLPFQLWADACIMIMLPFFYVPDIDQPECFFGWADAKYKFSAPYRSGARKLAPIPFNWRIA